MSKDLTAQEFAAEFLSDPANNHSLEMAMEVTSMISRIRRTDLTPRYYVMAYVVFSTQAEPKPFHSHVQHLCKFVTSHTRVNYDLLKKIADEDKDPKRQAHNHDPYKNLKRHE